MNREFYIDKIRVLLTVLVILHHTFIAYGASGGWCYISKDVVSPGLQIVLSAILSVNQAFFMSLFFFISAYFMPGSYDRKGFSQYLKDRLVRLGIPLLIYCTLINPTLIYFIQVHSGNASSGLGEFIINSNLKNPNTAHLWFVLSLLVFETFYAFYRKYGKISLSELFTGSIPGNIQVLLFILVTGSIAFLLRTVYPIGGKNFIGLQFGYFTLYIAFYLLGIITRRKNWLEKYSLKTAVSWFIAAVIAIPLIIPAWLSVVAEPALVNEFTGGFHWRSAFLAFWEAIVCTGFCMFILVFAKLRMNRGNNFLIALSANTYAAYIIHPVIVVALTILMEFVPVPPYIKMLTAGILGSLFCFGFAQLLRMIPGVKKVL